MSTSFCILLLFIPTRSQTHKIWIICCHNKIRSVAQRLKNLPDTLNFHGTIWSRCFFKKKLEYGFAGYFWILYHFLSKSNKANGLILKNWFRFENHVRIIKIKAKVSSVTVFIISAKGWLTWVTMFAPCSRLLLI